jgi:hypothetical protein
MEKLMDLKDTVSLVSGGMGITLTVYSVLNGIGWGVPECLVSWVMEHTGEDPMTQAMNNVGGAARGNVSTDHDSIWRTSM